MFVVQNVSIEERIEINRRLSVCIFLSIKFCTANIDRIQPPQLLDGYSTPLLSSWFLILTTTAALCHGQSAKIIVFAQVAKINVVFATAISLIAHYAASGHYKHHDKMPF